MTKTIWPDFIAQDPWLNAFVSLLEFFAILTLMHLFLPETFFKSKFVKGYVCDVKTGKPLMYRLNGLWVQTIVLGFYHFMAYRQGWKDPTEPARHFVQYAFAAFCLGLIASTYFFVRGRGWFSGGQKPLDYYIYRAPTVDMVKSSVKNGRTVTPEPKDTLQVPEVDSDTGALRRRSPRIAERSRSRSPIKPSETSTEKSEKKDTGYEPKLDFDKKSQFSFFYDFWTGHEFNPRITPDPALPQLFIDVKMYLYMWGAALLLINVMSIVAAYSQSVGGVGPWATIKEVGMQGQWRAVAVWAVMLTWFLTEYMYHEHVHLLTYDIFAEKIGFKLLWGCIFFYPYFYAIGGLPFLQGPLPGEANFVPYDMSSRTASLILGLFAVGWMYTRGANMQKYQYKTEPEKEEFKFMRMRFKQETISAPGGKGRLLCSGFWSKARHVNYFGEIIQAIAIALPGYLYAHHHQLSTFWQILPWLYPLYYVALFIPRELEDERICAKKYGEEAWKEYTTKVPYRIIPYVY